MDEQNEIQSADEGTEGLGGAAEGGNASENATEEPKTDREEGGPTAEETDEDVSGGAHGTRPSEMESHE